MPPVVSQTVDLKLNLVLSSPSVYERLAEKTASFDLSDVPFTRTNYVLTPDQEVVLAAGTKMLIILGPSAGLQVTVSDMQDAVGTIVVPINRMFAMGGAWSSARIRNISTASIGAEVYAG